MKNNFIEYLKTSINQDFVRFLQLKNKKITKRTEERYISDINYYFENYIDNDILVNSFREFFYEYKIQDFLNKRTGSTARAAISNLLHFFHYINRITSDEFLTINKSLKKVSRHKEFEYDFIEPQGITIILNNLTEYRFPERDRETRILAPLICSLAYNLLFEQDHIIKLKWSDINLKEKKIRNLRSNDGDLVLQWLDIDKVTLNYINEYMKYFKITPDDNVNFLIIEEKPANNDLINKILGVFRRIENTNKIKTEVDIQKLHRSRIYTDLIETNGACAVHFFRIMGFFKNTQLESALKKYIMYVNSKMTSDFS